MPHFVASDLGLHHLPISLGCLKMKMGKAFRHLKLLTKLDLKIWWGPLQYILLCLKFSRMRSKQCRPGSDSSGNPLISHHIIKQITPQPLYNTCIQLYILLHDHSDSAQTWGLLSTLWAKHFPLGVAPDPTPATETGCKYYHLRVISLGGVYIPVKEKKKNFNSENICTGWIIIKTSFNLHWNLDMLDAEMCSLDKQPQLSQQNIWPFRFKGWKQL